MKNFQEKERVKGSIYRYNVKKIIRQKFNL